MSSFIIGAGMAIGLERYRVFPRALISGFIFMHFTKPDSAYVMLWGPPLFLPVITLLTLQGEKDFVCSKSHFVKYLGLSIFIVFILLCTLTLYANIQLLLEGNNILRRAH
jgi:hypothetical protein